MRKTYVEARTVDEAIRLGLEKLGLSEDQVEVRVLEEPKSGLFGLFGKLAKVELLEKEPPREETASFVELREKVERAVEEEKTTEDVEEKIEEEKWISQSEVLPTIEEESDPNEEISKEESKRRAREFLEKLLTGFGLEARVECFEREDQLLFNLLGIPEKSVGMIIGKRGDTLDAIQYLTNLVANRSQKEYRRVVIDLNNYRAKREKTLKNLAKRTAREVVRSGRSVRLNPMNPYERRIIHATVHEEGVETISEGEEPNRYVVVKPKK